MVNLVIEVVGWIGAVAVVGAYGLAASGLLPTDRPGSAGLNLVGAAGLLLNSAANQAWPSAGLNLVWLVIGVMSLARFVFGTRKSGRLIPGDAHRLDVAARLYPPDSAAPDPLRPG
ncbi:CBU_0592 family membrane protein [Nocardioides bigeumensis]|uniref:CBU-0592-like domain-containing protein n=1 Tax=Nocardioides bigeumensis TaxID=433657 RepID=A0ABP5KGT1_9ACTN